MSKWLLLILLLVASSCNPFGCAEHEPNYFAAIRKQPAGKQAAVEITFNRKLSECVNGFESDDFAWQTIEVENPTLNGHPLKQEKVDENGWKYSKYTSQIDSGVSTDDLTFLLGGRTYISNPSQKDFRIIDEVRIQMT